jgi:hypothetical protein
MERDRQRPVGYIAAQHIDNARDEFGEIIAEARKLLHQSNTPEERYMRLGKILDAAHQGKDELGQIRKA